MLTAAFLNETVRRGAAAADTPHAIVAPRHLVVPATAGDHPDRGAAHLRSHDIHPFDTALRL